MTSKEQRRREFARAKLARQQAKRAAQERQRRRLAIIASAVAVVVVIAGITFLTVRQNGDDTPAATAPSATSSPTDTTPLAPGDCEYRASGTAAKPVTPPANGPATVSGTYDAAVVTSLGTINVTLNAAEAPCTVESFVTLAAAGYYADTPCHRITTADTFKVLQCGDPTGSGSGGPGYEYNDELSPDITYTKGTLAMANAGANTNGSQFFLVYGDTTLDPNYTVFGTFTDPDGVIDKVAAGGVADGSQDGAPVTAITITSVTVTPTGDQTTSPATATDAPTTPSMTPTGTAP